MIEPKKLKKFISKLTINDSEEESVVGNGVRSDISIRFNKRKLDLAKPKLLKIFNELNVGGEAIVSLKDLTLLKDGTVWNNLDDLEDFQALELFLCALDASGIVCNNDDVRQMNNDELGSLTSLVITKFGIDFAGGINKWLQLMKKYIMDTLYVIVSSNFRKDEEFSSKWPYEKIL